MYTFRSSSCLSHVHRVKQALGLQIKALQLEARELVRANTTRWSSFYHSFKSILALKEAIIQMLIRDSRREKKERIFNEDQLKHVSFACRIYLSSYELL